MSFIGSGYYTITISYLMHDLLEGGLETPNPHSSINPSVNCTKTMFKIPIGTYNI